MYDIKILYEKYLDGRCNPEEVRYLLAHFNIPEDGGTLSEMIESVLDAEMPVAANNAETEAILADNRQIIMKAVHGRSRNFQLYVKILAAASLMIITGVFLYLITRKQDTAPKPVQSARTINVPPGGNKAVLVLADGRKLSLQNTPAGSVSADQGVTINKTTEGELIYSNDFQSTPKVNTIVIPWGGQYRLQLADGTKVWLNAASTLKYPTSFSGMSERGVELSGEAYFEVTPDKSKPFTVHSGKQQVKVLGTHFNVHAYADEDAIITTLEEGSVSVSAGREAKVIKPGQQTILRSNKPIKIQLADLNVALSWKDNKMTFKDAGIQEVMRQVARWYNIKIEYQGAIADDTITGTINRNSNLSSVLKMFDSLEIKFVLEQTPQGKKLIITP